MTSGDWDRCLCPDTISSTLSGYERGDSTLIWYYLTITVLLLNSMVICSCLAAHCMIASWVKTNIFLTKWKSVFSEYFSVCLSGCAFHTKSHSSKTIYTTDITLCVCEKTQCYKITLYLYLHTFKNLLSHTNTSNQIKIFIYLIC